MGSMAASRCVMSVVVALLIFPYITVATVTFSRPLQWDQLTSLEI